MNNPVGFRAASAADWPAIEALLLAANLPLDGAQEHLSNFIVGDADGMVCCVGGYERYERQALLRSVAVADQLHGQGIGEQLLAALKAQARAQGIDTLYLLTTTATAFFARRGFAQVERSTAPVSLQASREFQGVCPASATMMVAALTA